MGSYSSRCKKKKQTLKSKGSSQIKSIDLDLELLLCNQQLESLNFLGSYICVVTHSAPLMDGPAIDKLMVLAGAICKLIGHATL